MSSNFVLLADKYFQRMGHNLTKNIYCELKNLRIYSRASAIFLIEICTVDRENVDFSFPKKKRKNKKKERKKQKLSAEVIGNIHRMHRAKPIEFSTPRRVVSDEIIIILTVNQNEDTLSVQRSHNPLSIATEERDSLPNAI